MISNSTTLVSSASAAVTDTVMVTFAAASPHISVKADTIATIGGFTVTNSQVLGAFGLIVSALDAGAGFQSQFLGFLVRFGSDDRLRLPFDCRTAFTVFRLFPCHHRLRFDYVVVTGHREFGETGAVVG